MFDDGSPWMRCIELEAQIREQREHIAMLEDNMRLYLRSIHELQVEVAELKERPQHITRRTIQTSINHVEGKFDEMEESIIKRVVKTLVDDWGYVSPVDIVKSKKKKRNLNI